ncbi:MAG: hypothetical protein B7Z13_12650 [Caulobacterales bacterium 32-67-6]|nr:MAG: hypothetical protein B7Z13_12650 [Caulobacterales bacterium 32-67-6]
MSPTELWYRAKKLYSIYPGVVTPVSGTFLAGHYARRRQTRSAPRAVLDAIVGLAFLAWIPHRARGVQRRFGLSDGWRERAVRIARARFADPNDIALFRIEEAGELDGYIRRFEDAGLNKRINPLAWTPDCALADKIRFYERCAAHGVAHPQVVATIVNGRVRVLAPVAGRSLLLKPARGEGGRGVRFLDPAPEEEGAFAQWLDRECKGLRGPWLVQTRIVPHGDLRDIALNALPTARITTILNETDRPEVVYGGGDYQAHPVTGAVLPGRAVPDWAAAMALVIDAHGRAFADYALIGWDVGFAPEGPVLIEGNGKPGVLMPQRAGRRGLGGGRYGELLAWQLARREGR